MNQLKHHFLSMEGFYDENTSESILDHTDQLAGLANDYERQETLSGRALETEQDALEGAETDIASLESLIEAICEARDVGLESISAGLLHRQVQEIQQRYGVSLKRALPSLEDYHGRTARLATTISLEAVGETLSKVWLWIKAKIKQFWEFLKKHYHHLTQNLEALGREVYSVKKTAQRMKFAGGAEIDLGRFARKLEMKGEVPRDFASILQIVGQINQASEEKMAEFQKIYEEAARGKLNDKYGAVFSERLVVPRGFNEQPTQDLASGLKGYVSDLLPGNRVIVTGAFQGDRTQYHQFGETITIRSSIQHIESKPLVNTQVEAFSSQEVFSLCQRLEKAIVNVRNSRVEIENNIKMTEQAIDKIVRDHSDDKEEGKVKRAYRDLIASIWKHSLYSTQLLRHGESITYDVVVGYLAWARKSIAVNEPKVSEAA